MNRLPGGRLAAVVTVRGRDAAAARGEAGRALARVWSGALEDAVVTVEELHRQRRGWWSVEWSTHDPGGGGGGAAALVPRRPRGPVGPVAAACRVRGDDVF